MKLRKLEAKDANQMLEWMHDPEVNRNFRTDFSAMTMEDVCSFIGSSWGEKNRHYAISDDADVYQGTISLKDIDSLNGTAEYAIVLRHSAQGKGYASFATHEILRIAFEEMGLHKVYLNVLKENTHAAGFYEHMGFTCEGNDRERLFLRGRHCDLIWYGMLSEEWHG